MPNIWKWKYKAQSYWKYGMYLAFSIWLRLLKKHLAPLHNII